MPHFSGLFRRTNVNVHNCKNQITHPHTLHLPQEIRAEVLALDINKSFSYLKSIWSANREVSTELSINPNTWHLHKYFVHTCISLDLHNNPMKQVLLSYFYRCGNWGSARVICLGSQNKLCPPVSPLLCQDASAKTTEMATCGTSIFVYSQDTISSVYLEQEEQMIRKPPGADGPFLWAT